MIFNKDERKICLELLAAIWKSASKRKLLNVLRFIYFCIAYPMAASRWAKSTMGCPEMRQWVGQNPRMLLKPLRPYLTRGFDFESRVKAILSHYEIFATKLCDAALATIRAGKKLQLASLQGKKGEPYQIALMRTEKFDREGELILELSDGQQSSIYRYVFSLIRMPESNALYVGCIQGPKQWHGKEMIKKATKDFHGIRPKNLLADALYALSGAWSISQLNCVSNLHRVYCGKKTRADYDSFWAELGGARGNNGMYELPSRPRHHLIEDVARHHRPEYRKRMVLREILNQQISDSILAFKRLPKGC